MRNGTHHQGRIVPSSLASLAIALAMALILAPSAVAIVGVEGTMDYAIDAPWRIEPSAIRDGAPVYGAIPILISIHDANTLDLDHNYFDDHTSLQIGRVCSVVVRERAPGDPPGDAPSGPSREFLFSELGEIEFTRTGWPAPDEPVQDDPAHFLCRRWAGEDCSDLDVVAGSSEWHASLDYTPASPVPGTSLSLQVEVRLTKTPQESCEATSESDILHLRNEMRIYLSPEGLPRFGDGWLYGDLHYHSQGTDNEGESGYSYRNVLRAMGAMGMDFAFATEHASNSAQIVDLDARLGDIFNIEFPPRETRIGLRDMSDARFRFLHDVLNGTEGANLEAGLLTSTDPSEPPVRLRPMPQIFLGGEVDMIPELPPGTMYGDSIPWGNGMSWSTENLCFGTLLSLGPLEIDCGFLGIHLLEQTASSPDAVLVDDVQGFITDFGRHHIVYLPHHAADPDAFVRSDTGRYGGAHRRFVDLKPEIEAHGSFFAAHSFSHYERGDAFLTDPGPTDIPWTDHMYDQAWRSPSFLGLQFWNEDAHLREAVAPWSATTVTQPFPAAEFCATILGGPVSNTKYICPTPGGDVGYERYDSHVLGIPYAYVPVDNARSGFGTGEFHLNVDWPVTGLWGEFVDSVEEKLHHGAFTWDRLNHWGLDARKTTVLPWLASFLEPRRLFMAGGSDAHGDLNYRRTGYVIRTEKINNSGLGKPRNLVDAGAPAGAALSRGPGLDPVVVPSQEQVAAALEQGRFSITNGPALRIVVDLDRDGEIDPGEPGMGDLVELDASLTLPIVVEWKSTPEFGPVAQIDLYLGARASEADLADPIHENGRTYAPYLPAVRHRTIPGLLSPDPVIEAPPFNQMNDNYWEDPTGQLRFLPADGFEGTKSIVLDLSRFPAMQNRRADRFFVRAFAITYPTATSCLPTELREECLSRYAFTNPIWAIEKTYLCSSAAGLDSVAPEAACNAPETLPRHQLPITFRASAQDLCGAAVTIHDVDCYAVNSNGIVTQRHCVVSATGDSIQIDRADGEWTRVAWWVTATDPAGNATETRCEVRAVND